MSRLAGIAFVVIAAGLSAASSPSSSSSSRDVVAPVLRCEADGGDIVQRQGDRILWRYDCGECDSYCHFPDGGGQASCERYSCDVLCEQAYNVCGYTLGISPEDRLSQDECVGVCTAEFCSRGCMIDAECDLPEVDACLAVASCTDCEVPPEPEPDPEPEGTGGGCCRVCTSGKPCGDSCISRSSTCRTTGGCACQG